VLSALRAVAARMGLSRTGPGNAPN
jgi:hypothetical protein